MLSIGVECCEELLACCIVEPDSVIVKVSILIHVVDVGPTSVSY